MADFRFVLRGDDDKTMAFRKSDIENGGNVQAQEVLFRAFGIFSIYKESMHAHHPQQLSRLPASALHFVAPSASHVSTSQHLY